jgi:hypothetical protein
MSMRSMITNAFIALVLVGASLPAAGQTELSPKESPEVTHNTWTSGAPMPTPVYYPAAGVLTEGIFIVGGGVTYTTYTSDVQIYNPVTNTWSAGVPFPTTVSAAASAVVKNVLYIFGGTPDGTTATNAVWAYNAKAKSWSAKATMPTARLGAVAVVDKNIVYVIDGYNGDFLTTVESYNTATNTWTEEAPELVAKIEFQAGRIGSTIVAIDGVNSANVAMADNEAYNIGTNTWTSVTADPTARTGACGGAIGADMYVAGGYDFQTVTLTESFKLSKHAWATLAPLPQATLLPASAVYKKQLYCIGGITTFEGTMLGNVQIYQP